MDIELLDLVNNIRADGYFDIKDLVNADSQMQQEIIYYLEQGVQPNDFAAEDRNTTKAYAKSFSKAVEISLNWENISKYDPDKVSGLLKNACDLDESIAESFGGRNRYTSHLYSHAATYANRLAMQLRKDNDSDYLGWHNKSLYLAGKALSVSEDIEDAIGIYTNNASLAKYKYEELVQRNDAEQLIPNAELIPIIDHLMRAWIVRTKEDKLFKKVLYANKDHGIPDEVDDFDDTNALFKTAEFLGKLMGNNNNLLFDQHRIKTKLWEDDPNSETKLKNLAQLSTTIGRSILFFESGMLIQIKYPDPLISPGADMDKVEENGQLIKANIDRIRRYYQNIYRGPKSHVLVNSISAIETQIEQFSQEIVLLREQLRSRYDDNSIQFFMSESIANMFRFDNLRSKGKSSKKRKR